MMKRLLKILCGILLVMGSFLIFLFYEPQETYDPNEKQLICIMNSGPFFWEKIKDGMEQAASDLGVYVKYETFPRFDLEEQLRLLDETSYLHTDGIITIGEPYSVKLNEKIRELKTRGVPVVLIDTDSPESGRDCYIGTDNYKAGALAAEKVIEETDGNARIAVFTSKLKYANQQERLNGFKNVIQGYENSEIVEIFEGEGNKIKIAEQMETAVSQYPSINTFFCEEAASTAVAGTFLKNSGANQIKTVIGFDYDDTTRELLLNGLCTATIVQDIYDMGYRSVQFLHDYDMGTSFEDEPSPTQTTDVFCLTRDNLEEYTTFCQTRQED